jgi:hypothetical protein
MSTHKVGAAAAAAVALMLVVYMIRLRCCVTGVCQAYWHQLTAHHWIRKSVCLKRSIVAGHSVICLSESWHHLLLQVHSIKQIIGRQYGDGVVADAQRHW